MIIIVLDDLTKDLKNVTGNPLDMELLINNSCQISFVFPNVNSIYADHCNFNISKGMGLYHNFVTLVSYH